MNHLPAKPSPEESPSVVSHNAINAEKEKSQSSSSSDSEDFFQLESTELGASSTKPPRTPIFVDNGVRLSAKYLSRKPPAPARYDVPDPNRIPMSVFARNTATTSPKEWSVTSNESLFSIQLGNSSFSREQGMLLMEYAPPRVPSAEEMKERERDEEKEKEKMMSYSIVDGISRQSDCSSTTSFGSFAFPILASEGKSESIKVMSKQYAEHQLHPFINSLNAPPITSLTTPPSASAKRRWFSCLSWCQFCC